MSNSSSDHRDAPSAPSANPTRVWAPAILVVDDEVVVRGLLQEFLVLEGYRVLAAGDGAEALDLYRRHSTMIDGVILDLVTPYLDSCDVFETMRQINPAMPIVLTSDVPLDARAAGLVASPGTSFVQKPFSLGEVLIRLEDVLDHARARARADAHARAAGMEERAA